MLWAIVGLAGSGKSTLFRLLTHKGSALSGKGLDVAVLKVPDERLDKLANVFAPQKVTPAEIEFADMVGRIDRGGSAFGELQRADGLVYCIRAFDGGFGEPNPHKDLEDLKSEFAIFDLGILEGKTENITQSYRTAKPDERQRLDREKELVEGLRARVDAGEAIRELELSPEQMEMVTNFGLLTAKPVLIVFSCDDERYALRDSLFAGLETDSKQTEALAIMAQMELELGELDPQDADNFRRELGLAEGVVPEFVRKAYDAMSMITFFTGSEKEVTARTIKQGTRAVDAAGKVHTDLARGFIRAEVISCEDLLRVGNWSAARSEGILRQEGKDYIVRDGDVILIKFAL